MTSIYDWSKTAGDNDDADSAINWLEQQNPDTVNNSARAMMARQAEYLEDIGKVRDSSGAANAYEITIASSPTALPDGLTVSFKAHQTNTAACTLKVNTFTAPLRATASTNMPTGAVQINRVIVARYDLANDEFLATGAGSGIQDLVEDTTPQLGGQLDANGFAIGDGSAELLKFVETGSAINELTITNAATAGAPKLSATGDDTNIDLELEAKGTGVVEINNPQITVGSDAHGDVWFRDSSGKLKRLPPGTSGQQLQTNGSGSDPSWENSQIAAWVNFDGSGTVAIRDSLGVSSITDNAVGDYTINLSVTMADTDFAVVVSATDDGTTAGQANGFGYGVHVRGGNSTARTTTSARIQIGYPIDGTLYDQSHVMVLILGSKA